MTLTIAEANELVVDNLRFAQWQAARSWSHMGRGIPLEDAQAAGLEGMVRASRLFDPERGFKFITYAKAHVQSAVYKACQDGELVRWTWGQGQGENIAGIEEDDPVWVGVMIEGRTLADVAETAGITIGSATWRLEQLRKKHTARPGKLTIDPWLSAECLPPGCELGDPEGALNEELDTRGTAAYVLREARKVLPPKRLEALERYYLGGELYREIGPTRQAAQHRVRLALETLRRICAHDRG